MEDQNEVVHRSGQGFLQITGFWCLSSVLRSQKAVEVNIEIIKTFIRLKEILLTHKNIQTKINQMEKQYNQQFTVVFDAIKVLLDKAKRDNHNKRFDL